MKVAARNRGALWQYGRNACYAVAVGGTCKWDVVVGPLFKQKRRPCMKICKTLERKFQEVSQRLTLLIHHQIEPISAGRKQVVLQGSRAVVCVHNVAGGPAGQRSRDWTACWWVQATVGALVGDSR